MGNKQMGTGEKQAGNEKILGTRKTWKRRRDARGGQEEE
jgi:hypothetical protein